ncbi:MAG: hypothetical protein ACK5XA_15740 [Tagaea sp.]
MGWGPKAPPPDPRIAEAAAATAQLGRDALDWYRNYESTVLRPATDRLRTVTDQQQGTLAGITQAQLAEMQGALDYRDSTFRPLERDLVAQARDMNTADFANRKATQASADVETAYQRAEAARRMDDARMGIAPSAGVARAEAQNLALRAAAGKAGAMTGARDAAEALKFDRGMAAAGLGRNLTGDASRAAQLASAGAGSIIDAESNVVGQQRANAAPMQQGFSSAIGASQAAGGLYANSSAQAQQAAQINAANNPAALALGAAARYGMSWLPTPPRG